MTDSKTTSMILTTQSTCNTFQIPAQLTAMAATGSMSSSISMIPTAGETSPTTVLVDVMADCSNGVSKLKRIQDYSSQLLLPEEMIYQNDLIKVWSIEDEEMAGGSNQSMTQIGEEPTYNKASVTLAGSKLTEEMIPTTISFLSEEMDESSVEEEEDDLLLALSHTALLSPLQSPLREVSLSTRESGNIKTAPELPLLSPMSYPQVSRSTRESSSIKMAPKLLSAPLSPMPFPRVSRSTEESGNTKMVVIDDSTTSLDQNVPAKTIPSRGHRRGHRRNKSHFDFQFL